MTTETPTRRRRALMGVVLGASVLQGIVRTPHAKGYRGQSWRGRRDPVDDTLLGVLGFGMLAAPLVYGLTDRLTRFDYPLGRRGAGALASVGIAAEAFALWLFHRSHADLGRNWTPHVELREEQDLVTDGVYARIRNPMYASQFAAGAAQACLLQNWIAGPFGIVSFLPFYLRRIHGEEAVMRSRFGPQWDAYVAETGRVLPRLR